MRLLSAERDAVLISGNHAPIDAKSLGYFLLRKTPLFSFSFELLSKCHFGNHSCSQKV